MRQSAMLSGPAPPHRYSKAMPSYRLILTVGALAPGVQPESVLPSAAEHLGGYANVESFDLRISRGVPQLVLRYTGEDRAVALDAALRGLQGIRGLVEVTRYEVLQRVHGRWEAITRG